MPSYTHNIAHTQALELYGEGDDKVEHENKKEKVKKGKKKKSVRRFLTSVDSLV